MFRLAALSSLVIAACGGSDGAASVVVRDSAGIEIVENRGDDDSVPHWRLEGVLVSIGVAEGDEPHQLDAVQGALVRSDRILVLDGGSGELRFFDRAGRHLKSVGRRGEGPGEFWSAYWLGAHRGDSIAAYDIALRRVSIFDADGSLGRTVRTAFGGGYIAGRLRDGTFIVRPVIAMGRPEDVRPGIVRDSLPILRGYDSGERLDTVVIYPGTELAREVVGPAGAERVNLRIRPFGLSTLAAAGDTTIYLSSGDDWAIEVFDAGGRMLRSIRRTIERPRVTQEHILQYGRARLAAARDENARRAVERSIASASFPERLPPHGNMLVDDLGHLWVQDYRLDMRAPIEWTVFDPSGRMVGRIATPARLTIHQIGTDFVLGRDRDELDVERVVLHSLVRF